MIGKMIREEIFNYLLKFSNENNINIHYSNKYYTFYINNKAGFLFYSNSVVAFPKNSKSYILEYHDPELLSKLKNMILECK